MASDDIKLGFRNSKGKLKTITVRPREGRLAKIWLDQLEVLLDNHLMVNDETGEEFDNVYQKNFSILGMPNKYRSADHILDDLDWAIDTINDSESDYEITDDFTPLRQGIDQPLMNKLHKHFEVTQGQLWNPSSVLANADGKTRLAICLLNHCCHELEAYYDPSPHVYFYYNLLGAGDRIAIPASEKKNFTRTFTDGMVYLHYAQTGKMWYEAYLDKDEEVGPENISEHRIITGEFNVYFGDGFTLPKDNDFRDWVISKGGDPDDAELALGYAPVADVIGQGTKIDFKEFNDFFQITFRGRKVQYDYRHNSDEFRRHLIRIWDQWSHDTGKDEEF